jgi:hypothetical protein
MAGQFYASAEWLQLISAMHSSNWTVCGRNVRIIVLGPQRPPGTSNSRVSFLGWKSQPDAALILSQCDILYCPYPFDPAMKEVSRYSFPSKLVLYLAAGRPIVFHGPAYSAPAYYIKSRECGLVAERLSASAVYNELERLVSDQGKRQSMELKAQEAFRKDFTLESMQRSFNAFIGASTQSAGYNWVTNNHTDLSEDDVYLVKLTKLQRYTSLVWLAQFASAYVIRRKTLYSTKLKMFLRRHLLKIPRIRSLHHEIHALYEEKATLKKRNVLLQEENTRLALLLRDRPVTPDQAVEEAALAHVVETINALVANPQLVSSLYPGIKTLVLASSLKELRPIFTGKNDDDRPNSEKTHLTVGSVSYALLPHLESFDIATDNELSAALSRPPSGAIKSLTRFVLQEGIERILISGEDIGGIMLAATAARLTSRRVTVIADAHEPSSDYSWLKAANDVDFVDAPPHGL